MANGGWQHVWSIFEEAIGLPMDERDAWLDQRCADDPKLRQAVDKLLAADRKADRLLDQPIVARPEPAHDEKADATATMDAATAIARGLPAETIGPYRLLRKIGEGGMSTVFLAARDDDTFRRRVVLKLIRRGLETEAMVHRLRAERQILASLTHPHIARLYDGGATDEGLPYFVMEHIDGETIDVHCARQRLDVDARLALFLQVCDAVRYAHQNLVVHRDLKPANIMVSKDGEPKLLDFGIAKLLNPELADERGEPTATWQGAMTPSYASPEQIRGKLITTASDVYSLGVVLYRLLTGTLPYDFRGLSPSEIERLLTETEPTRPSTAVRKVADTTEEPSEDGDGPPIDHDAHRRELEGDLDAILLKALRSAPSERYASVEQLATDLENYRAGRPVLARKGTWRYRTSKFVRRNRLAVAASLVAAITLSTLITVIAAQSVRVKRERDEARRENARKRQVTALMLDIFELTNPYVVANGTEMTVRRALEQAAPLLVSRLQDQPDVQAELLHNVGAIHGVLGDHAQAATELGQALTLRRALRGDAHVDVIESASHLVTALANQGKLDEAEALARETIEDARQLAAATGDPRVIVTPLAELVYTLCLRSDYTAATAPADEAWAIIQANPEILDDRVNVAEFLGIIHSSRGDYRAAAEKYREAVAGHRSRVGDAHPIQINALSNLGMALRRQGELDAAEATYVELLALQRQAFGEDVKDPVSHINLAGIATARGDHAKAEALLRVALEEEGGPVDGPYVYTMPIQLGIASARLYQGFAAEAEGTLRTLLATAKQRLGVDHWRVAQGTSLLGAAISAQGRLEEAEPLLVDGYRRLVEGDAKARFKDDALERLRTHLERAGRGEDIARYQALRTAEPAT